MTNKTEMPEISNTRICILGAGSFGSAMAIVLGANNRSVTLWDYKSQKLDEIQKTRQNSKYLPGKLIPDSVGVQSDLRLAVGEADVVVLAIPSRSISAILPQISDFGGLVVSLIKGLDTTTGETISMQTHRHCPLAQVVALGGPTFADEIVDFVPSAMVAAGDNETAAGHVQEIFNTPTLRIYTSDDIKGVEIGGALKNVIAIAAGVSDGLGFGDNSKAALATRALVEIQRLGAAMGGQPQTFLGLSGLGDLMATCFSRHSRNRRFGHFLGEGASVDQVTEQMGELVEGVPTSEAAWRFARDHSIDTPIIDEVHAVLYRNKSPKQAIADLIGRRLKAEAVSQNF